MSQNTFPGDLAQCFSIIHRAFQRDALPLYKDMGLNATSAYILLFLHEHGDSSQNSIARTLVINKGQIAREIKRLSEHHYVSQTQSASNRTTNVIHLTKDGGAVVPTIIDIRNRWWQERLTKNGVDPEAPFADTLVTIMHELVNHNQQS